MDRRTFLRWTAASGLAVTAPSAFTRARAANAPEGGPVWITIHAGGGWDPTLLCDPKGRRSEAEVDPVNMYLTDDIEQIGPFLAPPVEGVPDFFRRWRDQLLVLNGVDTQTNSHEVGTRNTWSGTMDPGFPALGAMMAAGASTRPSLGFLSNGGYDATAGLIAPTRLPSTSSILAIAHPERLDPDEPESMLLPADLMARVGVARDARLQRLHEAASLPRVRRSIELLQAARSGDNELARLSDVLPEDPVDTDNDLIRQAETALSCFQAGVSIAATLETGGFDTHGDHDNQHQPRITAVVEALDWILTEADRRGLAERLVIVVGSDFARTPWYNDTNGKDHWSITSMMLMGAGIRGGRVIGATDARQVPLDLDPVTLQPKDGGVHITPAHVHAALRELAGISGTALDARFPVGSILPLLG